MAADCSFMMLLLLLLLLEVVVVVVARFSWPFGELGGADDDDEEAEEEELEDEELEEADESDEAELVEDVVEVEETFFAVSAALFLTIRLIDDTEGRLSSSQIPSDCNWFLISQANIVGFAFL